MYIERVQIEEGFLAGLDVTFAPGLNTVIGARGTGKTSLIELIRFCLDASGASSDSAKRSREHAMSILGSGQVTVTLNSGGQRILVTRTASESAPRSTAPYPKPLIFSQTEIETVGLTPVGRIGLIDSFLQAAEGEQEMLPSSMVRSLSIQIEQIRRELEDLRRQLSESQNVDTQLELAIQEEQALAASSSSLSAKTAYLKQISGQVSYHAAVLSAYQSVGDTFGRWYQQLEAANTPQFDFTGLSEQVRQQQQNTVEAARQKITEALHIIGNAYHSVREQSTRADTAKLGLEAQARQIRTEVDALQSGAGAIMRRGQELREHKAKLQVIGQKVATQQAQLDDLITMRDATLDRLEAIRLERSRRREAVAASLNASLGPSIRLKIIRNGQAPAFQATISDMLRGSGLKYGEVVGAIARQLSPRALVHAVDTFDWELLSQVANIGPDRASRMLSFLRSADLGAIATLNVDDDVEFQLLDGRDYKDFAELSTGQRCTVVLPILLAHRDRILIVDQPEDHIDNAFITGTLIQSILSSAGSSQILFSTHNPNIPVLGDAASVVHLGSDGRRGYALASGPLKAPHIVSAISSVMEGGAEAFSYRAKFYGNRGGIK
ncbi:hypothetical protein QZM68_29560 [Burkholderia gladioli]|uniref:AAA family ATPase n=1 Tax=Burkholderia gladioli TaxID=28095 RepID=UPI0026535D33|nr:AAA family ATPase [Burkholderia gladioli]MDN7603913.1 hypothetical protein [Burkholderia gladioli]